MATYVVTGNQGARVMSSSTSTWTEARDGTGSLTTDTFYECALQSKWTGPTTFRIHQLLLGFDTSSISSSESVVSSAIRLVRASIDSSTAWTLHCREYDFGSTIAGSDFVPGANLAALPLLSSLASSAFPSTVAATSFAVGPSATKVGGSTRVIFHNSIEQTASEPVTGAWQFAPQGGNVGGSAPRLIVHTVQPSTLMGVHDAAVQLSDGSTVYLESDGAASPTVALKRVTTGGAVSTLHTYASPAPSSLQHYTLVTDDVDSIYVVYGNGSILTIDARQTNGALIRQQTLNTAGFVNQVAAVFCDAGAGQNNKGRFLVAYVTSGSETGRYEFLLTNIDYIQTGSGTFFVASGTNPAWLVSSSLYRNTSGTGLSLATDVFGGTRVGAVAWSNDALTSTSGTVTHQTRGARFTVGATITEITTELLSSQAHLQPAHGGKVVGYGSNQFVAVWDDDVFGHYLQFEKIGTASARVFSLGSPYTFDIVYDTGSQAVWAYYWDTDNTRLMKRPYYPATNTLGTAELVTTFAQPGTRDFIRTVKHLRNPSHVQVHYNVTN